MTGKIQGFQTANESKIVLQLRVREGKIICEDPVDVVDRSKGKKNSDFRGSWPLTKALLAFDSSIWNDEEWGQMLGTRPSNNWLRRVLLLCRAKTRENCQHLLQLGHYDYRENMTALPDGQVIANQLIWPEKIKNPLLNYPEIVQARAMAEILDGDTDDAIGGILETKLTDSERGNLSNINLGNAVKDWLIHNGAGLWLESQTITDRHVEAWQKKLVDLSDCNASKAWYSGSRRRKQTKRYEDAKRTVKTQEGENETADE